MANDHDTDQTSATRSRFSALHTRTYEAELLISGAVVFALFQIGPVVIGSFEALATRLEGNQRMVAIYGQTYLGLVIYALIAAFILHLAMRAFWIGLVGLESVYPDGVRWDRLKAGPIFIEQSRRRMPPLATTIERLDDLCSLIFSFGFMIVVVFLYSILVLVACAVAGFLLTHTVLDRRFYPHVFWATFGLILGSQILGNAIDRVLGNRLRPEGLAARIVNRMVAIGWVLSPFRWIGQIQLTLQSHTSNTRVSVTTIFVMLVLGFGFIGAILIREGVIRFDSQVHFPNSLRDEGLDSRHYRDRRPQGDDGDLFPSIDSVVNSGPYLELSIPYWPRRHNRLIRESCPDLEPFHPSGLAFGYTEPPEPEAARATLLCLSSLFSVEMDGVAMTGLVFDFAREAGSGQQAIVTFVPMGDLESGRHELVVWTPSRGMAEGEDGAEPTRHRIPFWR